MLRDSGIAAAISTFLPLSQGDRRGADLGVPECLRAVLSDMAAVQNRHTHTDMHRKLSLSAERVKLHILLPTPEHRTHCFWWQVLTNTTLYWLQAIVRDHFFTTACTTRQLTDWMENNRG